MKLIYGLKSKIKFHHLHWLALLFCIAEPSLAGSQLEKASANTCRNAQAQLSITPNHSSPVILYRNSAIEITYSIQNNIAPMPTGLKNLTTSLVPNATALTQTITNTCPGPFNKGDVCTQKVTINAAANASPGDYTLRVFTCDNGTPTKFCAQSCQALGIRVLNSEAPTTTSLSVAPNPLNLIESGPSGIITVQNTGLADAHNISATTPSPNIVSVDTSACPATLAKNDTCFVTVTPMAVGTTSFNIFADNTVSPTPVTVNVLPTPPPLFTTLSVSPSSITKTAGDPTFPITITNTGSADAINLNFTQVPGGIAPITNVDCPISPVPLLIGQTCSLEMAPTTAGSGSFDVTADNAPTENVPVTINP